MLKILLLKKLSLLGELYLYQFVGTAMHIVCYNFLPPKMVPHVMVLSCDN